jgi:outer membrane receptor protein involved in Fe transport
LTAGGRVFRYDNDLIGFFGFGRNPAYVQGAGGNPPPNAAGSTRTGVAQCFTVPGTRLREAQIAGQANTTLLPAAVAGSPCTNLAVWSAADGLQPVRAEGDGFTHRLNLTYKPNDDVMFYGTWSRGFRPGGINRRADVAPYDPDYLTNFELGWKTTLGSLRFNGAVYQQNWANFQFSYLGANSFTEIHNGPDARIRGIETDISYSANGLSITASASYTDAKTTQNLCTIDDPTYACTGAGNFIAAPSGTRLPVTPRFKAAMTTRYSFDLSETPVYVQLVTAYQSSASTDLRTAVSETFSGNIINPAALLGRLDNFFTAGISAGVDWDNWSMDVFVSNLFDERGQLARYQQCGSCGQRPYIVPNQPRTIGIRTGLKF